MVSASVVSHQHGDMIIDLVKALCSYSSVGEVIVTTNVPEKIKFSEIENNSKVKHIVNKYPRGFGANHNSAFLISSQPWFCPINPDIIIKDDPFPELISYAEVMQASLVSPMAVSPEGFAEDNWRKFPTIYALLKKLMINSNHTMYRVGQSSSAFHIEWTAGLFMLIKRDCFQSLRGFDEGFFLYYEDVDLCARLWLAGFSIIACPQICIVHDARRSSHRQIRYFIWHLKSIFRYLRKHVFLSRSLNEIRALVLEKNKIKKTKRT